MSITNGTVQSFKKVSNSVYVWTVKSSTSGTGVTTVSIGANTATDGA